MVIQGKYDCHQKIGKHCRYCLLGKGENRSKKGACEQNKGKTEVNRTFGTHYG